MTDPKYILQVLNRKTQQISYYRNDDGWAGFTTALRLADFLTMAEATRVIADMQRPNGEDGAPNRTLQLASGVTRVDPHNEIEVTIGELVFTPRKPIVVIAAQNTMDAADAVRDKIAADARAKLSDVELAALGLTR